MILGCEVPWIGNPHCEHSMPSIKWLCKELGLGLVRKYNTNTERFIFSPSPFPFLHIRYKINPIVCGCGEICCFVLVCKPQNGGGGNAQTHWKRSACSISVLDMSYLICKSMCFLLQGLYPCLLKCAQIQNELYDHAAILRRTQEKLNPLVVPTLPSTLNTAWIGVCLGGV